ncbi:glutaminyl-peptide cyclotransferase [Robiginitalea myxolifaciens]|nr:glutaminyl-peptide cyclotransferase [Robiginitalea myxolifaciens]
MWKAFISLVFPLMLLACGADSKKQLSLRLGEGETKFTLGQSTKVRLVAPEGFSPDSVHYIMDGKTLEVNAGTVVLQAGRGGNHKLTAQVFSDGEATPVELKIQLLAPNPPEIFTYEILNTYPHDIEAFTQGLEFKGDTLYESTGQRGHSSLRKVDYKSGKVLTKTDLEPKYFGEGLTLLDDSLYMLTWQSNTGFIYDPASLERKSSFSYGQSKEGWGLCNDGQRIYKSDGSERIWILNPKTMTEEGYIETVTNKSVFNKANELEYVDGKIYANVWQKPSMMIIDAETGIIEGVVNFSGLRDKVTQHPELDVFNGVAYHAERQTFFVTGKKWDRLFEVKIVRK